MAGQKWTGWVGLGGWADREKVKGELVACAIGFQVTTWAGIVCVVLGIIGDAANMKLGLEPMSWFLLAIVFFLAAIFTRIGWAVCWYLNTSK